MRSITPFLWFDADLAEPISYYQSVFPELVVRERRSAPDGTTFGATLEIAGQQLMLMNGGPTHAGFTDAISLFVTVETQAEIDELWARLTADGGEPGQCGWLKDRYGLSWQIVPTMLGDVLGGPDGRRSQQAMQAMLAMTKLNLAALQAAYDR